MGEVRINVKLINATDEGMARRGLLQPEQVRQYAAAAMVDTSAVVSVLPRQVFQQLGLAAVRQERARFANEAEEDVDVTEAVGLELEGRRTTEEMFVLGDEVLIGQTVLERLDLLVDCRNGRLLPGHPQGLVLKIK